MDSIRHVRKTDLARNTHQVIREVQRGQTVLVENHGQPEAAILDIVDYRLLRAVLRYFAQPRVVEADGELSDADIAVISDIQSRFDVVLSHYLAGAISLARAAEILGLSWLDLRTRFLRLDIPLRTAPVDLAGAEADASATAGWLVESDE